MIGTGTVVVVVVVVLVVDVVDVLVDVLDVVVVGGTVVVVVVVVVLCTFFTIGLAAACDAPTCAKPDTNSAVHKTASPIRPADTAAARALRRRMRARVAADNPT